MCGIVGIVGGGQAAPALLSGLSQLEYRGYDSVGVAVHGEGGVRIIKAKGRLENLERMTDGGRAVPGCCGIGHTRWATHGAPDAVNAHPHASPGNRVVMVHNGIIENHRELASELAKAGYVFASQTDTEAAVLLLDSLYGTLDGSGLSPQARALRAIRGMMERLRGSYALGILFGDQPQALYAVRRDSPLVVGTAQGGETGCVMASDVTAALGLTRRVVYMADGEIACLTPEGAHFYDASGTRIEKQAEEIRWDASAAQKGGYAHFMLKEIDEQPAAVRDTVAPRIRTEGKRACVDLSADGLEDAALARVTRLYLIGCGSAYHAACVGRAVIERLARVPCEAELASEMRYREPVLAPGALAVVISQSGETADSLAALRLCRARGLRTLAVVNVVGSSIAREADAVLYTWAGPEISVATTKAFSAQLAVLYLLAIRLAAARGEITPEREMQLAGALLALPQQIGEAIAVGKNLGPLAQSIARQRDVFFIGRGLDHAAGMEGSLKLKEISYIHSEAYAAGELKHGAISLIAPGVPVIAIATQRALRSKTLANLEEARSRGAQAILIAPEGWRDAGGAADHALYIPDTEPLFAASLAVIPLQMLAYRVSCELGLDVDKPRNLAKSVTVE